MDGTRRGSGSSRLLALRARHRHRVCRLLSELRPRLARSSAEQSDRPAAADGRVCSTGQPRPGTQCHHAGLGWRGQPDSFAGPCLLSIPRPAPVPGRTAGTCADASFRYGTVQLGDRPGTAARARREGRGGPHVGLAPLAVMSGGTGIRCPRRMVGAGFACRRQTAVLETAQPSQTAAADGCPSGGS